MWKDAVVGIHLAPAAAEPLVPVGEVLAVAGRGLTGDRYFLELGTYSPRPDLARQVTLIEIEALEALERENNCRLAPGESRRNIETRGVPLNHLVGRRFRIGEAVLEGIRLCEPCAHLAGLTRPQALPGLIHRGGLRAQILTGGWIRVGDAAEEI